MAKFKKSLSLLLSLLMILGMVILPSPVSAEGKKEIKEAPYTIRYKDGKAYKAYKMKDVVDTQSLRNQRKNGLSLKSLKRAFMPMRKTSAEPSLGDPIPDAENASRYAVDVQWTTYDLKPGDIKTPVYFQIVDTNNLKAIGQTKNVTDAGKYEFYKLPAWNDSDVSHSPYDWECWAPEAYEFDIHLQTASDGSFDAENVGAQINQRGNPIYRAEYYTNKPIPSIEVQRTNKEDETDKVPINKENLKENEYYSWAKAIDGGIQKPFYEGKKLDILQYGNDTLESLQVSDDITAGRVKMYMKAPGKTEFDRGPGTFTDNGTPYHYEVTGDHIKLHIFTIRQDLKVNFDANGGTWVSGNAPADQTIGHSMKLGDKWAGLGPITVPKEAELKAPAVKPGEKEKKFIGWNTDKNATTALFTDNTYATPITKDETFYAIYVEKPQGIAKVKYNLDGTAKDASAIDAKYKIAGQDYPAELKGNLDEKIKDEVFDKTKAPKFIGYEIDSIGTDPIPANVKDTANYTKNGDYTVIYKYNKLDPIIPANDDNGNPNPKATDDVKATYVPVTIKVDTNKGQFKKGGSVKTEAEFKYYVNPVEDKSLQEVLTASGLSAEAKDAANIIDTAKPWKFTPDKTKTDTPADVALATEVTKANFGDQGVTMEVNFKQTLADQLKDKFQPETIKVWKGDTIDWEKGVKKDVTGLTEEQKAEFSIYNDKGVQTKKGKATFGDATTPARDSSKQNLPDGKNGNIKITFSDGSSLVIKNQMLYVADHKVPIKDGDETNKINPDNLPTDKIAVKFLLGEGVKIGDKNGNETTPVLYETFYVKPGTSLEDGDNGDIPKTEVQDNYKNNKWYNGDAELTKADYTNITKAKEFIAKAEQTDAKKYGDQLKAKDIVKWVGEQVDWTKGVEEISGVTFKSVADLGNRNTTTAGVFTGKLKVTFNDDSTKEIDKQKLIVRAKKAEKVTPDDNDPGTYPKDALEVKFVAGTGIKALNPANKVMVLKSGENLVADDYPEVTVEENFKKMDNKTDYYDVEPGVITEAKTITASTTVKGEGTAVVKFVDTNNKPLDPKTDDKLQIAGEKYDQSLSGKDGVKINYDKSKAPKILGYKLTDKDPVISTENFKEGQQATITLEYEKLDDIIPGTGKTEPDGYVTIKFTAQKGAKLTGETTYYVNPKADKTLADTKAPEVSSIDAKKYEVKTGKDLWKPVLNEEQKITKDETFEAQVIKIGEPSATYPNVNIEKGETKDSNPTIKDKKGQDQKPTEKPEILDKKGGQPIKPGKDGKITIGDPEKGIKLIPKADGQIIVEVPKDYDGPNDVTVTVKVTIPGETIETELKITIGKPEDPKPSSPAITWWYLGDSKTEPVQPKTDMETGRHYKYLYGYVDKTVRPEGMITRSEAAALIARLANLDMTDKTKPNFKDTPSAWYNGAINAMVAKNLMFADKDGNFRPNEPITRGEFARALYYIDKKNDKVAPFADVKGHEFEDAINQAYGNGRIAGYQDGTFKPNANIQRAEAARILNQYADRNVTLAGMANVKNDLVRFTDINESHWAYCEVMEAANSHEYQRAKGSQVETWLRILDIKADWE